MPHMEPLFEEKISEIDRLFHDLLAMTPIKISQLPKNMPKKGIYLFSEGEHHLYVGRSNDIRRRFRLHSSKSASHLGAAFAFRLAREATGNIKASYKPKGSRKDLMRDPVFVEAFEDAIERIRNMDVCFVEESEPVTQAILEIYVSIALQTPYNDFDNH